ncbi:glutathione s-transferase, putative [Ricinus communis]|uniref:Glutathione s-transferase, putative n=1 Tax=Ricinus communis TaxID=3988 RepID=B9TGX5_RICCO|nr:glutathione s-transferase, putative [Ricinus communis]
MVDFPPKQKAPEYLEINPIGSLPFFIDGDTRINESAAILEYLAAKYDAGGLRATPDEADFGQWLNWIHFGEASLTTPLATVFRYAMGLPKEQRLPQVAEDYAAFFFDRLQAVERAVSEREYLCGRFTLADISVGYALYLANFLRLGKRFPPAVSAYFERLQQRPAFAAAANHGMPQP